MLMNYKKSNIFSFDQRKEYFMLTLVELNFLNTIFLLQNKLHRK